MSREAAIRSFLQAAGWADASRAPLAGDASARRYERLRGEGRGVVLMDMPPESGLSTAPFLGVTAWLRGAGFSAPAVLAAAPERGLVLLEDLGDDTFARLCAADSAGEEALYAAAIDCLAAIQRLPPPEGGAEWLPPRYDMSIYLREARLAAEWYLPAAAGAPVPAEAPAEYAALVEAAVAAMPAAPAVAVLVDYHVENLVWLPGRAGVARVGILDHQDLRVGHPAYDVISLLEDARRDTSPELRAAMRARYLAASGMAPDAFVHAAHVLAAQRNLKILGLFTRLSRRDGKPRYLRHLPRVWDHLMRDLEHPALAPLSDWVRARLPAPGPAVLARIGEAGA